MLVSSFRRRLMMALGPSVKATTLKGRGRIQWQGAFAAVLPRVVVYGEGKQDGTPTPDNPIEPVFGGGGELVSRGRNLFDMEDFISFLAAKGNNAVLNDTYLGEKCSSYQLAPNMTYDGLSFRPKTVYRISARLSFKFRDHTAYNIPAFHVRYTDGSITVFPERILHSNEFVYASTRTNPSKSIAFIEIPWFSSDGIIYISDLQIEESSTPTPYTPYIDLGTAPLPILRALPDGSVRDVGEIISGVTKREIKELDATSPEIRSWTLHANREGFTVFLALLDKPVASIDEYNGLSNRFLFDKNCSNKEAIPGTFNVNDRQIYVTTTKIMTIDEWKTYISRNPVRFWYELAEPIIEHYDPAILRQHPGYTQLIRQGGFQEAEIEADVYPREEVTE